MDNYFIWLFGNRIIFKEMYFEKNNFFGKVLVLKIINFICFCNLLIIVNILYLYIIFLVFIFVKYFYVLYLI